MAVTVRVQDCQSIKDATIVVEGLTVITGPNNSGKTAFMRAIRTVFTNGRIGSLIRQGSRDLVVTMEFDTGKVEYRKGKTKPTYTFWGDIYPSGIQGVPLHPGAKVPSELFQLGIYPLEVGNRKIWPQVAKQFAEGAFSGPMFLLDQPGSVMAETVSDVERVGRLSQAMKSCESDRRNCLSTLKVRKQDLLVAEKELQQFDGLEQVATLVSALDTKVALLHSVGEEINSLVPLRELHFIRSNTRDRLAGISLVRVPSQSFGIEARRVAQSIVPLRRLQQEWETCQKQIADLSPVEDVNIPSRALLEKARTTQFDLGTLSRLHQEWVQTTLAVDYFGGISEIEIPASNTDIQDIQSQISELVQLEQLHAVAFLVVSNTRGILDVSDLDIRGKVVKIQKIIKGLRKLQELQSIWVKAQSAVVDATQDLSAIKQQILAHDETTRLLMEELGLVECTECGALRDIT